MIRTSYAVLLAIDVDSFAAAAYNETPDTMEDLIARQVTAAIETACGRISEVVRVALDPGEPTLDARLPSDPEVTAEYTYDTEGSEF